MTKEEIRNNDIMVALDSMALILGEDQVIVEISDEDDDGNITKVTPITPRMIREEYEKLFNRVKELEEHMCQEAIIEECQDN